MVRKIVAGMVRMPAVLVVGLAVLAVAVVVALQPREARGATYTDPWWSNASPSPECACDTCGCEKPSEWTLPGVSVRTGEFRAHFPLFSTPGRVGVPNGVGERLDHLDVLELRERLEREVPLRDFRTSLREGHAGG